MSQQIEPSTASQTADTESKESTAPLISDAAALDNLQAGADADNGAKPRKRDFFKFGKKTETEPGKSKMKDPPAPIIPSNAASQRVPIAPLRPISPLQPNEGLRASSPRSHPYGTPASPGQGLYSSSPRMHSPASSQIFERNVQEDVMPPQASPQIPSHIITENHIPPALDATSAAITNKQLDPDSVEIITHSTHQPAAVTITGVPDHSSSMGDSFHHDHHHPHHLTQRQDADNTSNYAALDNADVRRLSFISFADVVHAEHAEAVESGDQPPTRRDSAHPPPLSPLAAGGGGGLARSPSPMRSPVSSPGAGAHSGTSPPSSVSPSFKGLEGAPASPGSRRGLAVGSPIPGGQMSPPPLGGSGGASELNIETMSQALRSPASGDLSGHRGLMATTTATSSMTAASALPVQVPVTLSSADRDETFLPPIPDWEP